MNLGTMNNIFSTLICVYMTLLHTIIIILIILTIYCVYNHNREGLYVHLFCIDLVYSSFAWHGMSLKKDNSNKSLVHLSTCSLSYSFKYNFANETVGEKQGC